MIVKLNKQISYLKSIFNLASGTSLSQMITVASMLVLSRLYSPADFGEYATFAASAGMISIFATARLENLILSLKDDCEALLVRDAMLGLALLMGIVSMLSMLLIWTLKPGFINLTLAILFPFYIYILSVYQSSYFCLNRDGKEIIMSKGLVIGAISQSVFAIAFGVFFKFPGALICSLFIGQLINLAYTLRVGKLILMTSWEATFRNIRKVLSDHYTYPLYLIPSSLLQRFSSQAYIIIVSQVFGVSNAGQLNLYQRTISTPMRVIGKAIADTFKRYAASSLKSQGECRSLYLITLFGALTLSLPVFIVLNFYGIYFFEYVFGSQWATAGEYAKTLSWVFLFSFSVYPISNLILIGGFPRYHLFIQIYLSMATVVALYIGWLNQSIFEFIRIYTLVYCIKYIFEAFICWRIASGTFYKY